jgi:hypothetical protein
MKSRLVLTSLPLLCLLLLSGCELSDSPGSKEGIKTPSQITDTLAADTITANRDYRRVSNPLSIPTSTDRTLAKHAGPPTSIPCRGYDCRLEYQDSAAQIISDTLVLQVYYGGGCVENHAFSMYAVKASDTLNTVRLFLHHEGKGDLCEALLKRWLRFDISRLKKDMGMTGPITLEAFPEQQAPGSDSIRVARDTIGTTHPFRLTY